MNTVSPSREPYHEQIGYVSKTETCVLYPCLPRAYALNGFILIPSLSEKGTRGHFEIEVYSSEPVKLSHLDDHFYRMHAGEWTEQTAGGSHLNPLTFKKNPKFVLKLRDGKGRRQSFGGDLPNPTDPVKTRVMISRVGESWSKLIRKDAVGSMIGFYLFMRRSAAPTSAVSVPGVPTLPGSQPGELMQVYESTFVPDDDISTEDDFMLDQLRPDEEYVIMPTTFGDGKVASFVISVSATCEFSLAAEKK